MRSPGHVIEVRLTAANMTSNKRDNSSSVESVKFAQKIQLSSKNSERVRNTKEWLRTSRSARRSTTSASGEDTDVIGASKMVRKWEFSDGDGVRRTTLRRGSARTSR